MQQRHLLHHSNTKDTMSQSNAKQRVKELRKWMEEEQFDAFIVPTSDPHNSEYTPDHWKARAWFTGFDGSAGTAVVTPHKAALWTDSRYYLQAEEQLADTPFMLMRDGEAGTPSMAEWLESVLPEGGTVGFLSDMMTQDFCEDLLGTLDERFTVRPGDNDPFRSLWADRPDIPAEPLVILSEAQTGLSATDKLNAIYSAVTAAAPEVHNVLMNDLSEIAWTLNLRGSDIEFNPVFVSYLLIGKRRTILFTNEDHLTPEVRDYLKNLGISTARYKGWKNVIDDASPEEVFAFPATMNLRVVGHCRNCGIPYHIVPWPVPEMRSMKTPAEQAGFRTAMEHDGVAMVRFLRWLEEAVPQGGQTEWSIDKKLTALRAEQPGFCGLSFATIAGYGPHGAIVHYEATPESAAPLRPEGLLLLDSGAQYDCGTTDITRTIALGSVTDEERRVYTLVLKGHIALSNCRFPEGTTGIQLDLAARYAMWQEGYDFGHGTGHGVGHRLCVHEGPQQIRKNLRGCTMVPFRAGMTITDEPGIYVTGRFGVRIENTLLTVADGKTDFGSFLRFEPLTLCPIDLTPVDFTLLTATERGWLNDYHATVRSRLLPLLNDEADRAWLMAKTESI